MNIVSVIPISRGGQKEVLSYFTATPLAPGSIVKVPLRKQIVHAIVLETKSVEDSKSEIRSSPFEMRKVSAGKPSHFLLSEFIEASRETARYFAGTTGNVIKSFVPKTIFESAGKLKSAGISQKSVAEKGMYAVQTSDQERYSYYKSIIREQFGKKHSVLFCVPTLQDMKKVMEALPRGIEEYTYFFHGSLPKKEMVRAWNAIVTNPHPVLVIGTGSIFSLPRPDIGTIILERESAGAYKYQTRPYVDIRVFAEFFRKKISAELIVGDLLLRNETLFRRDQGEIHDRLPLSFRIHSPAETAVVDVRKEKSDTKEFKMVSYEVEEMIREARRKGERVFLYATRRGLSPLTLCGDCGSVVTCNTCTAPTVLHGDGENRFFLCHRCGERRDAAERCKVCNSWKLVTLGIGTERVEEIIKKLFPDTHVVRIDKEATPTLARGVKAISSFYAEPKSILIGTEMALLYLDKPIERSAVISIDSLFSIPDFRTNEKVMSIISRIRTKTERQCLIQTRYASLPIITYAAGGNAGSFYRDEIEERKKFNYPPISTLIKITYRGDKTSAWQEMEKVKKLIEPYELTLFPAFIEVVKGKHVVHGLIRIKRDAWIDEDLLRTLESLPLSFSVKVDPENLL